MSKFTRRAAFHLLICVAVGGALFQACGVPSATAVRQNETAGSSLSVGDTAKGVLLLTSPAINAGVVGKVAYSGVSFPTTARFDWSHELVTADTGEPLEACQTPASKVVSQYLLSCPSPGKLNVNLVIIDGDDIYGPFNLSTTVQ